MEKINRRVYFRVTNRCNRACSFCFYKNDPKQIGDMPISLLKSLIEKELENCPVNSRLYVEFTGGEPTLYKYLKESLEYLAKDKRLSITVETNCSTLDTSEFIDILDIFRIKDNYLKLSINTSLIASDDN
jgi:sulfatase maturation enzyme AslB (radical SAM superfamily)